MTDPGAQADAAAVDQDRRKFLTVATGATAAVGVVFAASPFVASWQPSERARALGAPITVDLSKLEVGQMVTYVWRKQPVYVFKRSPATLANLAAHDARLKDPQSAESEQPAYALNERRSRREDIAVLIATWNRPPLNVPSSMVRNTRSFGDSATNMLRMSKWPKI